MTDRTDRTDRSDGSDVTSDRWNCGRCGYLALSSPHEDSEKGTEVHKCPRCGEQWWLNAFTYSRMHPASDITALPSEDQP